MIQLAKLPHNEVEPQTRFNNDRFEFCFYDENGLAYYKIADDTDMPIGRKVYIIAAYNKFLNAISDSDFTISLDAMLAAIHSTNKKGQMKVDVARIGYICTQLKHRRGIAINIDLLTELAALYFFREDESIGFVNDEITQQKVGHLSGNKHLALDFFFSKSLSRLYPLLNNTEVVIDDLLEESTIRAKAYITELENYLTNG